MAATSSISGAQRQALGAARRTRSLSTPSPSSASVDPVCARDRVRLRGERDADLVPAAERHLQGGGRADAALERDRAHLAVPEERRDLGHVVRIARQVQVTPVRPITEPSTQRRRPAIRSIRSGAIAFAST